MLDNSTRNIDQRIVQLSGKKKPNALFIPTASSDDVNYARVFELVYGERLGCRTDVLYLLKEKTTRDEAKEKIRRADIIFVGGGNTLKMMRRWRTLGVDRLLKQAYREGKVCCGSSAGALCWFHYGHSDSLFYYNPENWKWIRVKCLGLVPFLLCPHYLKERRDEDFRNMVQRVGGMGIAVDDCAAFEIIDDRIRVISSKPEAQGFKVYKHRGKVRQIQLPKDGAYMRLEELRGLK